MRRLLLSIGLLLLPSPAFALTPPATLTGAISPWLNEVLTHADKGIATAIAVASTSTTSPTCPPEVREHIAALSVSEVRSWLSESVNLGQESEFLRERTVCVQYDRSLLIDKIRDVMDAMGTATAACDSTQSEVLKMTFRFLTRAYLSFLQGASDPTYEDDLLRYTYGFDSKALWDQSVTQVSDTGSVASLCPFSSDYGPHAIGFLPVPPPPPGTPVQDDGITGYRSYGCDLYRLQSLPLSWTGSTQPLTSLMQKTDSGAIALYTNVRDALMNLNALVQFLGGSSSSTGAPPITLPPHRSVHGCLRPAVPDPAAPTYADEIESLFAAFPGYFDPKNQDPLHGLNPPIAMTLPKGALFVPSFDFFTSIPNPLMLLRQFLNKDLETGRRRPLPQYLMPEPGDSSFPMSLLGQMERPGNLQGVMANVQVEIGMMEAGSRDALERMEDLSLPLKTAVSSLTDVVETFLPEKYIPDVAYFAARSCVDGPCQTMLETVLRRSLNPYCHPYLSGRYREDDSLKKCLCDPTIRGSWGDYDKYCAADYKRTEYEARPETLIPGCGYGQE